VTQALAPTLAELTTTTPLLQRVIAATGVGLTPGDLAKAITTHVPVGTSLIQISVSHRDPGVAAAVANAIASELRTYRVEGLEGALGLRVVLTVVDPAVPPSVPEGFGVPIRTALGAAVALFLGVSIAFFFENVGRGIRGFGARLGAASREVGGEMPEMPSSTAPAGSRSRSRGARRAASDPARRRGQAAAADAYLSQSADGPDGVSGLLPAKSTGGREGRAP
jgi:hypothetical protein